MKWWVWLIIIVFFLVGGFILVMYIKGKSDRDSQLAKARAAKLRKEPDAAEKSIEDTLSLLKENGDTT